MKSIKIGSGERRYIRIPFDRYKELFMMNNTNANIFWSRDQPADDNSEELAIGQEIEIDGIEQYVSVYSENSSGTIKFNWRR